MAQQNSQIREGTDFTCRIGEPQNAFSEIRGYSSLDDQALDEVYYGLPLPFTEAA